MAREITRRCATGLFVAIPGCAAAFSIQKSKSPLPAVGEFVRFADPVTETAVVRLTSPAYTNLLPASANRFISLKRRTLLCSSDRVAGKLAPFEVDLRAGVIRQLAQADALDPNSLTLDLPGRFLYFMDGGDLIEIPVKEAREPRRGTVITKGVSSFSLGASRSELFVLRSGRLEQVRGTESIVLAENAASPCLARPGGTGCLFVKASSNAGREFWYAPVASPGKPVLVAEGPVSSAHWSPDGESLFFLRQVPKENVSLSEVYQVKPGQGSENCVSKTSQFATFAPNQNVSVFVGSSGSHAQPNVLLLLRETGREMTLCEHRASQAQNVRPVLSPDSGRVYFQSDREGRSAIYSVNVEQLVEPT